LSTGFVGGFLAAYIAGRWFRAREGLVVGLLTAANAAGQLVFLPTMASFVTHFGWRVMSLVLAGAVIAFLPLRALLMRNRPEDVGLRPYGDLGAPRLDVSPEGNPITVAFRALALGARSRDFWPIAGGYFVCGATTNGLIGTHLIAACVDHGLSEVAGAGLLAATGIFAVLGGTLAGTIPIPPRGVTWHRSSEASASQSSEQAQAPLGLTARWPWSGSALKSSPSALELRFALRTQACSAAATVDLRWRFYPALLRNRRFADSPLEGDGFERLVPRHEKPAL
jgi:hypothetical protein